MGQLTYTLSVTNDAARADPRISAVFDYWRNLAPGCIPTRRQFDFMAVYRVAPYLILIRRIAPSHFKYVYFGTQLAELLGHDFTGEVNTPTNPGTTGTVDWPTRYEEFLSRHVVLFERRAIEDFPSRDFIDAYSMKCPLLDDAGEAAFMLNCLIPLNGTAQT